MRAPRTRRARAILLLLAVLPIGGCASRQQAARDSFVKAFTCPAERVTVTRLDGVRWSEVQHRASPPPPPPPEIRADPARLALWTERQQARFSPGFDRLYESFRVTGCAHRAEYMCQCPFAAPAWKQFACICHTAPVPLLPPEPRRAR